MASNESLYPKESTRCFHLPDPVFEHAHLRYVSNLITSILNAFFAPFAVVANVLVFSAILLKPSLRSPSCLLIACLAFSDILVSGIVQPSYIAYRLGEIRYGYVHCMTRVLYAMGFYTCYGVSFTTLSSISLERYLALKLHLRYKGLATAKRVLLVVILTWTLNIALTSIQWVHVKIARGSHLFFWLASMVIAVISQLKTQLIVRRHRRQILKQQPSPFKHHHFRTQVKETINMAYIVGIYLLFNLPVLAVTIFHQIVNEHIDSYDYYSWSETIAFSNSFINPLICFWRCEEIRKAVLKLVRKKLCYKHDLESRDVPSRA